MRYVSPHTSRGWGGGVLHILFVTLHTQELEGATDSLSFSLPPNTVQGRTAQSPDVRWTEGMDYLRKK